MGGTALEAVDSIGFGTKLELPVPERETYQFLGWYLYEQDLEIHIDENTRILGDWTLYAHWALNTYRVMFKDVDGMIFDIQHVEHGSAATEPDDPQRVGHTFLGWDRSPLDITSDTIITATYEQETYTITFDIHGGSYVEAIHDIPYGSSVELPVPEKEGYAFFEWFTGDNFTYANHVDTSKVQSDLSLQAI
jgi:uncharacterized repeat protein (TIGR02543 family)